MAETTGSIIRGPGSRNRDDGRPFDPFGWEESPGDRLRQELDEALLTLIRSLHGGDTRLGIAAPDDPGVCSEPRRTSRNVVIRDGIPTIRQGHKEIRHRLKP